MTSRHRQQELILDACARLGADAEDLLPLTGMDLLRISKNGRAALVLSGSTFDTTGVAGRTICWNKHATKALLREKGLPVPRSIALAIEEFGTTEGHERIAVFLNTHCPSVLKPNHGTEGDSVRMRVTTLDIALNHVRKASSASHALWLLEEQIEGRDLRMHCIGGRVVAACVREPAFVQGDGKHDLASLIEARQAIIRGQNPANRLVIDEAARALLAEQGVTMSSVPANGRKIRLCHLANMSLGAVATDVSDDLHPRWHEYAAKAKETLHMDIFALDAIANDVAEDPAGPESRARILEINGCADWLHHTFSEGRQHDIADLLVRRLLAE